MNWIKRWKAVALIIFVPLLVSLQPVISYACQTTGSHCGG